MDDPRRHIAIIGAGAGGCFCASLLSRMAPDIKITVYESGSRPLAKVAVTGGGRCNLTNSFEGISRLEEAYPRGARLMRRTLGVFGWKDTWNWFEGEGVRLVLQDDHCVFPLSQDAMQIVCCLENAMRRGGVAIRTNTRICSISGSDGAFTITDENGTSAKAYTVLVATGGSPKASGLSFLAPLDLETVSPVPSLFTFRIDGPVRELMGTVVEAEASLSGTKISAGGPLLITDWGMSGPAILKLSSYGARYLAENNYNTALRINWLPGKNEEEARTIITGLIGDNPKKELSNVHPDKMPSRLWTFILAKAGLREGIRCSELGSRGLSRLAATLCSDSYEITGRAAFKEEFVTCGGVALSEINPATMESRRYPGLYFSGEVLDIDAITGGFNLQAAWSTAFVAARAMAGSL